MHEWLAHMNKRSCGADKPRWLYIDLNYLEALILAVEYEQEASGDGKLKVCTERKTHKREKMLAM